MDPVSLQKGKLFSTIPGVVDTWQWFIDKIKGIKGKNGVTVTHTDDSVEISVNPPKIYAGNGIVVNKDDTGGYEISLSEDDDDDLDIHDLPMFDMASILSYVRGMFIAGDDTNITFTPVTDVNDANYGKVKVDVYYK